MKSGRPDATPPKREYPSPFQHKTLWTAITGAALLGTGAMSVYTISVVAHVLQFLQPVLVPVAFAGILAALALAGVFMMRDGRDGKPKSGNMMRALALRERAGLNVPFFCRAATPAGAKVILGKMGYAPLEGSVTGLLVRFSESESLEAAA